MSRTPSSAFAAPGVYGGYQDWAGSAGPLPLARRRRRSTSRHLLEAFAIRFRRLGGARMGMLLQDRRSRVRARGPRSSAPHHHVTGKAFDDFASGGRRSRQTHAGSRDDVGAARRQRATCASAWWEAERGAFIGAVHRMSRGSTTSTSWSPARCRATPSRQLAPPICDRAGARLCGLSRDGEGRGRASGRNRRGRDRDAQPPASSARARLSRRRHPCDLRQADRRTVEEAEDLVRAVSASGRVS